MLCIMASKESWQKAQDLNLLATCWLISGWRASNWPTYVSVEPHAFIVACAFPNKAKWQVSSFAFWKMWVYQLLGFPLK